MWQDRASVGLLIRSGYNVMLTCLQILECPCAMEGPVSACVLTQPTKTTDGMPDVAGPRECGPVDPALLALSTTESSGGHVCDKWLRLLVLLLLLLLLPSTSTR